MSGESAPAWVTFWDRRRRRAIVLSAIEGGGSPSRWTFVEYDSLESKPGVYEVWRDAGQHLPRKRTASDSAGDVYCVEVNLDEQNNPIGFPDHLLDRSVLGSPTLWGAPDDGGGTSYMWWSGLGAGRPWHDTLAEQTQDFMTEIAQFTGFSERVYEVGELLDNRKWDWGYSQGVYCFISQEEVAYVGRALGKTVGQRIWDQLMSQEDPAWKAIVTDRKAQVRVFAVERKDAYMASAFEAFLIDRLKPRFNLRKQ